MTEQSDQFDALSPLLAALCDGTIDAEGFARLERLLAADPAARRAYFAYMDLHGELTWDHRRTSNDQVPISNDQFSFFNDQSPAPSPQPIALPIIIQTIDSPGSPLASFVGSMLFPYMIATVIVGMAVLVAAVLKVSSNAEVVKSSRPPALRDIQLPPPKVEYVARITGMADCKWAQSPESRVQSPALDSRFSTLVALGDTLSLRSGLLEITYNSGAKVILQGPVTYKVESSASGYLSVGKLTARVEKRGERREERGEGRTVSKSPNLQISKSEISPLSSLPSPLFAVRTPTATVTDLGTEFGLEVDNRGRTISQVFRGLVRVQLVMADGRPQGDGQLLHENQSATVDTGSKRTIVVVASSNRGAFVHDIPKRTIKTLDLVDVLAGGDGFSSRRGRGIDPASGRIVDTFRFEGPNATSVLPGDGQYHRVVGMPFVDGAFIPDGGMAEVQVDSAGHVFGGFQGTVSGTWEYIWAGGVMPGPKTEHPTTAGGVDYASAGHGLVFLHASSAITFDLDALRQANPGAKLLRFRATAANTGATDFDSLADLWVLVDGQSRFQRRQINATSGVFPVAVPIGDGDRFLTLAATDGGNGISHDWIIFGDARLELLPSESKEHKDKDGL
jgi:hypothetical protein